MADGCVHSLPQMEQLCAGVDLIVADVLAGLALVADASVQCVVTSPPYLDARDYGLSPTVWPEVVYRPRFDLPEVTAPADRVCLGAERTLIGYVAHLVLVARALRRVLRSDGTHWLNLGTGYSAGTNAPRKPTTTQGPDVPSSWSSRCESARITAGLPAKQRIPAVSAVCDALQADGWWVRNRVVWHKPNAKPDSTRDRCSPAHEELLLLAPGPRYYFDGAAISTPAKRTSSRNRARRFGDGRDDPGDHHGDSIPWQGDTAKPRDVWTIRAKGYRGAHFATFPDELARRCILAGSRPGDVVLDPFAGSGTVGAVARTLGRKAMLIEASERYAAGCLRPRIAAAPAWQPSLPGGAS